MRLITITKCQPGMRLGKPIFNQDGVILLAKHAELTAPIISRLSKLGIVSIYIDDNRTNDIMVPELVSQETRLRAIREIRDQFRKLMDGGAKSKFRGDPDMTRTFRDITGSVVDELSDHRNSMFMLSDMCVTDHYLYQHSVNVCLYTTMLGIANGYEREDLLTLSMGALLHDIGKTRITQETLLKPGMLTKEEFNEIKKHSEFGFQILKDEPGVSLLVAHCAFQHHERINGSGYPRGLKGAEIHEFAKWIGVTDTYDAITSHRVYRSGKLPHEALEVLYAGAGTLFDSEKVVLFRDKIAIYPIGTEVKLNTGVTGVIVDLNKLLPSRPIVRILTNEAGEPLLVPYEIDLSKDLSLTIVEVNDVRINQSNMFRE